MTTEMIVVVIPWGVLLQPTVSMMDEGQAMYMRSMPLMVKIPNTPNDSSVRTAKEMISPMDAPRSAATRVVKKPLLRDLLGLDPCQFASLYSLALVIESTSRLGSKHGIMPDLAF